MKKVTFRRPGAVLLKSTCINAFKMHKSTYTHISLSYLTISFIYASRFLSGSQPAQPVDFYVFARFS